MGSYKVVEGNLIDLAIEGNFDIIAHGCNCQKIMGAGIAFQIANRIPKAKLVDQQDERSPLQRLGDLSISDPYKTLSGKIFIVLNLYTQFMPGRNLNYSALELVLQKVNSLYPELKIGIPLIGCGIAGGDWKKVEMVIQKYLFDLEVTVVKYKK